jgi:hypothetical protein
MTVGDAARHAPRVESISDGFAPTTTITTAMRSSTHMAVAVSATTTSTTTSTTTPSCGGVELCLEQHSCKMCLAGINNTQGRSFPRSLAETLSYDTRDITSYEVGFIQSLLSTPSCSTNATPPSVLRPALQELSSDQCSHAWELSTYACEQRRGCEHCV